MPLTVTIHRGTQQIGGSLIELSHPNGERLILDAGRALDVPDAQEDRVPDTLDLKRPATILVSHSHPDHWGLASQLPESWQVYCGEGTARLLTARPFSAPLPQQITTWPNRTGPLQIGAFMVQPHLTDHSAFDAWMLQVDASGQRVLYSGDFRRHGRKCKLVDGMMASPPVNVDMLIMEGTNLGTDKPVFSEKDLEEKLVSRMATVKGRIFVCWSGQNIDRTVSLYRAARRTGRDLVLDLYAAGVLSMISDGTRLPRPELGNLKIVLTRRLRQHYSERYGEPYIEALLPYAISAEKIERSRNIIMLRSGLVEDYKKKGVRPTSEDLFLWSIWAGYLRDGGDIAYDWCKSAGTPVEHLHTSGHASTRDLVDFAKTIDAGVLVPVHGENWDQPPADIPPVLRLQDGVPFTIPDRTRHSDMLSSF